MTRLLLFVLPLGLDTFAASAALGVAGLPANRRLRLSLLLAGFETAMPVAGLLIGHGLGHALAGVADYAAAAVLLALAAWMLLGEDDDARAAALVGGSGLALVGLGLGVSLDELAMGFTIGLLHLPIALAVALIGAQAFLLAQVGLRLGARVGAAAREGAETVAALALLGLGVLILVEKLS